MKSLALTEYRAPLECVETTTPVPKGNEVLLRVSACGVCHTDLHIWEGGYDLGGGKMMKMSDRGQKLPHTMGHEVVGEVIAAGEDALRLVEAGRTYLVYPWFGCGECQVCKNSDEHLCPTPQYLGVLRPGGYADYVLIPHPRYLIDIPAGIPPEQAAPYACSGLTAYSALKKLGPGRLKKPILIVGAGGLGLMCLSLLKAMGQSGAIVADIDPDKQCAALAAGAIAALDPTKADFAALLAESAEGGIHTIIDFVGSPASWDLSMGTLAKGGAYVIVGLFGGERTLSLATLPLRAITVSGSFVGSRRDLIELMSLVRTGVDQMPIVTRPLDNAHETLSDLREGRVVGRAVLVPGGPS
ncbi:alcohol dehydrogenase [Bradyrhizobium barranii subsp. apii]|uniref:alcohol dehydrogenase n=1 Tax=Bradyrhizobium barranii subsp. apii TaxID=2819348 RepID=A0A8T5VHM7_9BRAD|nr:alcohol dehydrogenase [Bradyrhizobium barranii]UPT84611.1 alcohol dehydrogenase [Bradyrhizobium barranii subsp. apii]